MKKIFLSMLLVLLIILSGGDRVFAAYTIEDFEGWGFVDGTPALSAGMYIHDPWKFVAKIDGVAANDGAIETWTGPAALSISTGAGIVDELHILKTNGDKFNFGGFNFTGTSNRSMVVTGWRDGVQVTQSQIINYTSSTNDEFFGMSSEDSEFKNVDEIRICGVDLGGGDYDKISGYLESFTYDMIPVDEVAPRVSSLTMTSDNANTELAKVGETISLHITVNEDIQSPTVTIASQNAAVSDAGDSDARTWEATYTMQEEDASGVVPFTLDFCDLAGNVAAQVTAVTLGNPVIFDKTPPSAPTAVTVTPVGGTIVANSLNSSNTNLTATATIIADEATGGKAELYIGGILCATDNTIAAADTQVTFDLGTSTTAELQAAIPSGGIVSVKLYDAAGNSSNSSVANPTLIVDYTPVLSDAERLQAAIDAAADGDTITLENDIDLGTTGVTVNNKTITLDLNDKTITYSGTAAAVTLSGAANLTVQDSGTNGTITSASSCYILLNNGSGTLTLASGTIKGTGTDATFGIVNQGTGSLHITGGTVQTTKMYALLIKANSGDVTISGGTVKSSSWGVINHNGNTAKLTISGNALIECTGTDASGRCFSINNQTASLVIQGGRIIGDKSIIGGDAVEISGGYIQPKIYSYYNITVNGGFLDNGLGFYSTGTGIVNGGYIYSSTNPLINSAGDLLKIYSVQVRDAGNNTVNNTPVTILSTDPVLDYAYGLNDVQTDVGGKLFVWLPEGITWFSVTAGGSTYSGAVTLNALYGYYEGTLRLASQNPGADVTTVAKTSAAQTSVAFPLTTAPTGTWKVYDSGSAADVMTGVSAVLNGTTLTLSASAGSFQVGDYYVSVTEPNKNESARLKLTVEEAPTILDAAAPVITSDLSTTQVKYTQNAAAASLTVTAESTDGGTLTYTWYSNTTNSTDGTAPLGVTTPSYTPSTAAVGTTYYFCVVTNTNNAVTGEKTAQTTSAIASIKVNAASGGNTGGGGSGGGGGGSSSGSTESTTPVITVSEIKSELFSNKEDIKVEADVKSAFGQSVVVKLTDDKDAHAEIFSLAGASDKVYSFDISLYSKDTGEKVQPKEGCSVKITLPVPEELLDDREKIKVVYSKIGKLETLKSQLFEKNGKWYIAFKAVHFSPYALIVSAEEPAQPETVTWTNPFSDVRTGDWYYSAVQYAVEKGLMKGTSSNTFSPGVVTSRGMIATILYNLDGSREAELSTFKDVKPDAYYAHAVAWAQKKGIIAGYGNGMFGPDDSITREQMATILWKYAGSPAANSQGLASFKDAAEISAYAQDALAWATQAGIINGKGAGLLDPKGQATRAETAQIMKNFLLK